MLLTIVLPCFNEELVLEETHRRLVEVLNQINSDYEIIYVNDGSSDKTLTILKDLRNSDRRVKVISLSRNYGHQIAITAGIENSSGDAVVILDADLQDPPGVIKEMVAWWEKGYDVVYGRRTARDGEPLMRNWMAKIFSRFLNRMSEIDIPEDVGDFRLLDRKVVNALKGMPERDRFLRGMVSWVGFHQVALPYRRAPRVTGVSKYSFPKLLRLATDGIYSFSLVPLLLVRTALAMGVVISGVALLGGIYALVTRLFTTSWIPGGGFLWLAVLFIGGMQLVCLGVVGEWVCRIYGEAKRRPIYLLEERIGFKDHAQN
jgi:polyisoprenyl-phosphate glycosyltransferase